MINSGGEFGNVLDPRQRPPEAIKALYKKYQKATLATVDSDHNILDISCQVLSKKLCIVGHVHAETVREACSNFNGDFIGRLQLPGADLPIYECKAIPGLLLIPSLLPPQTQWTLLSRLLHDALADRRHKTNVHIHHEIPYDLLAKPETTDGANGVERLCSSRGKASFFKISPSFSDLVQPLDPTVHRPYTISQFLRNKLRWIELGVQYDWSAKAYDTQNTPAFPDDIAKLMRSFFPDTKPEVAIVNLYSPGDTLSIHRDVSEISASGLISVSLGCDGIFVIGLEKEAGRMDNLAIRLRSGDMVYMSQAARYAWHGLPSVIPKTCPSFLTDWPAKAGNGVTQANDNEGHYEAWRGWMSSRRINLNIRQLNDG